MAKNSTCRAEVVCLFNDRLPKKDAKNGETLGSEKDPTKNPLNRRSFSISATMSLQGRPLFPRPVQVPQPQRHVAKVTKVHGASYAGPSASAVATMSTALLGSTRKAKVRRGVPKAGSSIVRCAEGEADPLLAEAKAAAEAAKLQLEAATRMHRSSGFVVVSTLRLES